MKNFSLLHSRVGSLAQRLMVMFCVLMLGVTQVWGAVLTGDYSSSAPTGWSQAGSQKTSYYQLGATDNYIQTPEFSIAASGTITVKIKAYVTGSNKSSTCHLYGLDKDGKTVETKNVTCSSSAMTSSYPTTTWTLSNSSNNIKSVKFVYTKASSSNMRVTEFKVTFPTTITLSKNNGTANGSIKYGHEATACVTSSFTAVTRTGYDCTGYWTAASGGTKILTNTGAIAGKSITVSSVPYTDSDSKWIFADAALTLHAQWTAKTISLTLNKNNSDASGSSNGSASVKYDATALESGTVHATRTGYELEGYYAEQACTHKVLTSEGALVNYTGYVVSGKWARATATTLYAKWTPVASCTATPSVGAVSLNGPFFVTHLKIFHHIIMSMFASLIL